MGKPGSIPASWVRLEVTHLVEVKVGVGVGVTLVGVTLIGVILVGVTLVGVTLVGVTLVWVRVSLGIPLIRGRDRVRGK